MHTPHWQWKLLSFFMVILQPLFSTPAEGRLCCPLVAHWEDESYQLSVGKELRRNIICSYEDLPGDCKYDKESGCPGNNNPSCPKNALNTTGSYCYPTFLTRCCPDIPDDDLIKVYQWVGEFECDYTFARCIYTNDGTLKKGHEDCFPEAGEPPTTGFCSTFIEADVQPICFRLLTFVDGSQ